MTAPFTLFLDAASIAEIKGFAGWQVILANELDKALDIDAQMFNVAVVAAQRWKNPTGALEGSFYFFTSDRMERTITTDSPYARRRNEGFSGMTDSLGRFYAHDPGAFFMDSGFEGAKGPAIEIVTLAVARALARLQGHL